MPRTKNPSLDMDVDNYKKALRILVNIIDDYANNAQQMNIDLYYNAGKPWEIISAELLKALGKMESRLITAGYDI